jgi:anti-anti-sigma factor
VWEALPAQTPVSCWVDQEHGVLRVAGEIDQDNAEAVTRRVVAAVTAGVVHLDLSDVTFFGAAGVRVILAGHQILPPEAPSLRVACSPIVLRVIRTCGLAGAGRLRAVAAEGLPLRRGPQP